MSERGGWLHYPQHAPAPGDCRHLCVIVQGDFHYIGIAAWIAERGGWWQNASPVQGFVWAFRPLPEDYPVPPNSSDQARMGTFARCEPYITEGRKAMAEWWETARLWNTGREGRYPGGSLG
jgi:hypothetical protein